MIESTSCDSAQKTCDSAQKTCDSAQKTLMFVIEIRIRNG